MSGCGIRPSSLLNNSNQFIKLFHSKFVVVNGPNMLDSLDLSDLRVPYKQVLKSRVILKVGATVPPYLLNFLGLGDNATFVMIKASYPKKMVEPDCYITYYYASNPTNIYTFANLLVLTGNSTNRIKQLYLIAPPTPSGFNPKDINPTLEITLDIMVAVIDDTYTFFTPSAASQNVMITGLKYTDIITWIINESIGILDPNGSVQLYIQLANVNSISRAPNNTLIIDDQTSGNIYLTFVSENDCLQALSELTVEEKIPNTVIQSLNPRTDTVPPIITFTSNVSLALNASPSSILNSTMGTVFYAVSLGLSYYSNVISKQLLISWIISQVSDNRDVTIIPDINSITILDLLGNAYDFIIYPSTYQIYFNIQDIAQNVVPIGIYVQINITA
jgi:hypothetical protein